MDTENRVCDNHKLWLKSRIGVPVEDVLLITVGTSWVSARLLDRWQGHDQTKKNQRP